MEQGLLELQMPLDPRHRQTSPLGRGTDAWEGGQSHSLSLSQDGNKDLVYLQSLLLQWVCYLCF